jgi:hypothetical protein
MPNSLVLCTLYKLVIEIYAECDPDYDIFELKHDETKSQDVYHLSSWNSIESTKRQTKVEIIHRLGLNKKSRHGMGKNTGLSCFHHFCVDGMVVVDSQKMASVQAARTTDIQNI